MNTEGEKCGTPCLYYGSIDEVMRSGVCDGKGNCVKPDKKLCAVERRQKLKTKKGNPKSFILDLEKYRFYKGLIMKIVKKYNSTFSQE